MYFSSCNDSGGSQWSEVIFFYRRWCFSPARSQRCRRARLPGSFVSIAHLPIGLADVCRPLIGSFHTMLYCFLQGQLE